MLTLLSLCTTYHEQIMWAGPIIAMAWALVAMLAWQEWGQHLGRMMDIVYAPCAQEWFSVSARHQEWLGNVLCQEVLARRYQRV